MANILVKLLMDATGYERGLQGAAGKTKAFEQAAATVTGTIGKLAGAFGLAMGASEALTRAIKGSQTTSDEYDRVMRSAKTTVDAFFTSLSTGDFSTFALGLDDLISKARAANDALDQLGNTTMSYGYFSSKERAEFADALKVLRDKNSTDEELKAAEAQMKGALERLQGYTEVYAKRSAEAMSRLVVEGTLLSAGQITQERIDEVLRLDVSTMGAEEKAALAERYKEYQEEIKRIKGEYTSYSVDVKGEYLAKNFDEKGFRKAMEPVNALYLDAIVYDQVLVKKNDEWLQQLINISKAANDAGRSLAEMYNQQREGMNAAAKTRAERAKAGGVVALPSATGLMTTMNGIGAVAESVIPETLLPVEAMNVYEEKLKKIEDQQERVAMTAQYAGQMFGAMGQMAAASGNEALAGIMNSFGAVADMVMQLQSLATAQGVSSAMALPFPANLGAAAIVMTTIASIWSGLNFAEGGIVPGSNYMDGITARVSSGEMVINTADQKKLYDAIHTGNLGGGGGGRMVVSGEQIVEVVNNYGQRTGRGRLTFK